MMQHASIAQCQRHLAANPEVVDSNLRGRMFITVFELLSDQGTMMDCISLPPFYSKFQLMVSSIKVAPE